MRIGEQHPRRRRGRGRQQRRRHGQWRRGRRHHWRRHRRCWRHHRQRRHRRHRLHPQRCGLPGRGDLPGGGRLQQLQLYGERPGGVHADRLPGRLRVRHELSIRPDRRAGRLRGDDHARAARIVPPHPDATPDRSPGRHLRARAAALQQRRQHRRRGHHARHRQRGRAEGARDGDAAPLRAGHAPGRRDVFELRREDGRGFLVGFACGSARPDASRSRPASPSWSRTCARSTSSSSTRAARRCASRAELSLIVSFSLIVTSR